MVQGLMEEVGQGVDVIVELGEGGVRVIALG